MGRDRVGVADGVGVPVGEGIAVGVSVSTLGGPALSGVEVGGVAATGLDTPPIGFSVWQARRRIGIRIRKNVRFRILSLTSEVSRARLLRTIFA